MVEENSSESTDDSEDMPDEELDEMMSSIEEAERRRMIKVGLYTFAAMVAIVIGVYFVISYWDQVFVPKVDMAEARQAAWKKTNDPQCREMISKVEKIGDDYYAYESTIDEQILGDDPGQIREIRERLDTFNARLDEAEEMVGNAALRYDNSRQQLEDWFDYMEMELGFLDRLAAERLAELEKQREEGSDGAPKDEADPDRESGADETAESGDGTVVEEDGGDESEDDEPEKTPVERRDGAIVAIDGAFQKFRVWHSASDHPCGKADEDEEPWRPDETDGGSRTTGGEGEKQESNAY